MQYFASLAVLWALACAPHAARAQSRPMPVVTQQSGTEHCPDAEALTARVEQLRNGVQSPEIATYHVDFSRRDSEFSAAIHRGDGEPNVRTITARGDTCEGLAQASAVTLALLLDGESEPPVSTEPAPPPAAPPSGPSVPAPVYTPQLEPTRSQVTRTFAAGAGVLAGVLRPAVAAFWSEAGLVARRLRVAVGITWTVPARVEFGPGTLRELVVSGTTRLCVAPVHAPPLRFDLCSGLFAGVSDVRARGYTRNQHKTRAWVAAPLGFSLSYLGKPAGIELSALALAPLHHHDFSIDGLGTSYASWPVALSVSLSVVGSWP